MHLFLLLVMKNKIITLVKTKEYWFENDDWKLLKSLGHLEPFGVFGEISLLPFSKYMQLALNEFFKHRKYL